MSRFLYVTVDSGIRDLDRNIIEARGKALLPGVDRELRIIKRTREDVSYYELFANGVAIAGAPRRRRQCNSMNLLGVGLAALESGGRIGISFATAPEELSLPRENHCIQATEALERFAKGDCGWYELDLGTIQFALHGVELRFWAPENVLGVATPARGFFANLRVNARTCAEMRNRVEQFATDHQASLAKMPAPEVLGMTEPSESGCEQVGGRALFP